MEDLIARRFHQGMRKAGLKLFCYREVFRSDELVEGILLTKLELIATEMLRWTAVSARVTRFDAAQRAATAKLRSSVNYYEEVRDRWLNKEKSGVNKSSNGRGTRKMRESKSKCKRERQGV